LLKTMCPIMGGKKHLTRPVIFFSLTLKLILVVN